MQIVSTNGTRRVVDAEFGEAEAKDGIFDVSREFAAKLLKTPHFITREAHEVALVVKETEKFADPAKVGAELAALRRDVDEIKRLLTRKAKP